MKSHLLYLNPGSTAYYVMNILYLCTSASTSEMGKTNIFLNVVRIPCKSIYKGLNKYYSLKGSFPPFISGELTIRIIRVLYPWS